MNLLRLSILELQATVCLNLTCPNDHHLTFNPASFFYLTTTSLPG